MKSQILFVLGVSLLVNAYAGGDGIGNGGDIIKCPQKPDEVLDLFQGRLSWGFGPILRDGSRVEIITKTFSKFSSVDSTVARKILARSLEMEKELATLERDAAKTSKLVKFTKNDLVNVPDEGIAELPPECEMIQAATQNQRPFPGEVKFTFHRPTWENLTTFAQASLIVHEAVYEHMISVKELPSRSTRYFTAALFAGGVDTVKGYIDMSSLFEFRNLDIREGEAIRKFGAKGICTVKRFKFEAPNFRERGTTIAVGNQFAARSEEFFDEAMNVFWQKYATRGDCD